MSQYPEVGSLWKYTGRNPAFRFIGGAGPALGNPSFEILPKNFGTGLIDLRIVGDRQIPYGYDINTFSRYFIPHNGEVSDQLAPFRAIISEALFQGIPKEEIYDTLVALGI